MNIATWNVQTVMDNYISERPERRTAFLACDLRLDVDIAALQETRLADEGDRKSTRLNSSHMSESRMPSSA